MAAFVGKYKLESQDHFAKYLKAVGAGFGLRVLAKLATPVVEFVVDGDDWTIITTGIRVRSVSFTLGVEQDLETLDGRHVKAIATSDAPNKMHRVEKWKGRTATYDWDLQGDDLTLIIRFDAVCCIRRYRRI